MKILILGSGPLPDNTKGIRNAGGLRTDQFLSACLMTKNEIMLITIEQITNYELRITNKKYYKHLQVGKNDPSIIKKITSAIKNFAPNVVVGVNTYPSFIAAKILSSNLKLKTGNLPPLFWADLNGWAMAEIQAQSAGMNSDAFIPRIHQIEKTILKKADKISVVSTPQKYAILGELASLGRLGKENFKYEFIEVIPNATKIFESDAKKKSSLKIPKGKFVVTQIGGFNSWLDEQTLFRSLEESMKKNSNIHFVCTGGVIENVDESTFNSFKQRIDKSKFKNNFHLLGWVETSQIPEVYAASNCTINVDFDCVETQTGARNRITESLKFGVPIITTKGSEIANQIVANKAGLGALNGDFKSISKNILTLAKNKKLANELSKNCKNLLKDKFSVKSTMGNFVNWLQNPHHAPDNGKLINLKKVNNLKAIMLLLKKRGVKSLFIKFWQKIK